MRSGSSAWLEYRLVTPGVASSNLVHSARIWRNGNEIYDNNINDICSKLYSLGRI